jgi:ABC-type sugar transport system substrate-binding protein
VPAFSAALVLAPLEFDASFSDALSVAGLGLSLIFGLGSRTLDVMELRLRIGVVIPSRVPFHTELRSGLREGLTSARVDVYDDYLATTRAKEDLAKFMPALRRTLQWRPDYLVVCSPSVSLVSEEGVQSLLRSFHRRGGGIVFIDNEPDEEARATLKNRYGFVNADVESAAEVLAAFVEANSEAGDEVLVLSGPPSSEPAARYRRVLQKRLPNASVTVGDPNGWTERATYTTLSKHLKAGHTPRFVLCGNDVMAFGAVRAVKEQQTAHDGRWDTQVLGYNGIARALFAIAEDGNPMAGTVCVPPAAYGEEIAAMILSDAGRVAARSRLQRRCIPISEGQMIQHGNVELLLDD